MSEGDKLHVQGKLYNYELNWDKLKQGGGYKRAAPRAEVMFKMHIAGLYAWQSDKLHENSIHTW